MPYIGTTPTKVVSRQSANVYRYTATAGQSVFTGADLDNNVLACNPADMIVHMNGLRLESTDYTATSTSVTLTTAATAGDEVTVTSFVTFEVADTYTKTAADSRYVNTTGDNMTGNLTIADGTNAMHVEVRNGTNWTGRFAAPAVGKSAIQYFNGSSWANGVEVDSAGRVTMPYQPAFHAYINSANPSFGSSLTKIPFNGTRFNIGNHFDTTNQRFVAPVAGRYHFTVSHNVYNVDVGNWWRTYWFLNGGTYKPGAYMYSDGTGDQTLESALTFNLSANDYVEVYTQSNDGSYSGSAGTVWNAFCGYLIG